MVETIKNFWLHLGNEIMYNYTPNHNDNHNDNHNLQQYFESLERS